MWKQTLLHHWVYIKIFTTIDRKLFRNYFADWLIISFHLFHISVNWNFLGAKHLKTSRCEHSFFIILWHFKIIKKIMPRLLNYENTHCLDYCGRQRGWIYFSLKNEAVFKPNLPPVYLINTFLHTKNFTRLSSKTKYNLSQSYYLFFIKLIISKSEIHQDSNIKYL